MSDPESVQSPERRGFLEVATAALLAIPLLGPLLASLACIVTASSREQPNEVPALPLAKIPEDSVQRFTLSYKRRVGAFQETVERVVFLRRSGNDVTALSAECTHLGCSVRFVAESDDGPARLACPCHAGTFSLEGKVLSGPPSGPLERFAVRIPDDASQPVLVSLG
jgi:Rieske Fe-S protein